MKKGTGDICGSEFRCKDWPLEGCIMRFRDTRNIRRNGHFRTELVVTGFCIRISLNGNSRYDCVRKFKKFCKVALHRSD